MGWARKNLGVDLNPINVVESIGRKIDDEILQPVKVMAEAIIDDPKKLAAVALAVAFPGAGAFLGTQLGLTGVAAKVAGQALINTVLNGGDVKAAVIGAVLPVAGDAAAAAVSGTLTNSGVIGNLNTVITRAVSQGTTAALLGKDPAAAFLLGGVSAGVAAVTEMVPGFLELPQAAQNAITTAATAKFAGVDVGDAVTVSLVNDAMNFAINKMDEFKKTGGITNRVVDEAIPQGDVSARGTVVGPTEDITKSVTDFLSNKPDYSLSNPSMAPGLKMPSIDSDVSQTEDAYDGFGIKPPRAPGLEHMGGGQGIVITTPEGTLSETGFRPKGTTVLGDPASFINRPFGDTSVQEDVIDATEREGSLAKETPDGTKSSIDPSKLIDAGVKLLGGAAVASAVSSATRPSSPLMPVNLDYGDVYKDAPIKGFSMRQGADGKFTPFIGDKAQLAKGGFVSKRKDKKTGKATSFVTRQK